MAEGCARTHVYTHYFPKGVLTVPSLAGEAL
jgi:hypothetical protein